MPLEIRELVIKLTIEDKSNENAIADMVDIKNKIHQLNVEIIQLTETIDNIYER